MQIREKDRRILLNIFASTDIPLEVWAYGSRVTGTAHDGSDLDLVIRRSSGQKMPFEIINDFKEKIQNSNIPILVELFDWARLPETFHKNILTNYEVLFSNADGLPES